MKAFWLDDHGAIDGDTLRAEGVHHDHHDVGAHDAPLAALMREHRYVERDQVELRPTTPDLDALLAKFDREHTHDEDEVRYVLEGEAIFDIRSRDDRWMRVVVSEGDLIVVPKQRHHRFELGATRTVRAVRLFQDRKGWVPKYR
ncbi:1,2-dihydroxy-3-keto-5-methylthiopentene dioxygenase [Sandaracinus amylolyticus]|uniref:acireductone dioxygenase (Fe(2+)-requiring) n=1 Tax=Sandaracinus amylolyticus TaxID=927083 RepID=A0A0F6W5K1_9BACT|nr:cupin domain-containing protein [Sandaracinus amylolyticus]AKF07967.1 1,2-dihydroxy-3-keto-5-methylthiopentene dioxygenase [Sandaracinus amylolyticus]